MGKKKIWRKSTRGIGTWHMEVGTKCEHLHYCMLMPPQCWHNGYMSKRIMVAGKKSHIDLTAWVSIHWSWPRVSAIAKRSTCQEQTPTLTWHNPSRSDPWWQVDHIRYSNRIKELWHSLIDVAVLIWFLLFKSYFFGHTVFPVFKIGVFFLFV